MAVQPAGRIRRLVEELEETGLPFEGSAAHRELLVEEIDRALRPHVHEKRIPSSGTIVDPSSDPVSWSAGTLLDITRRPIDGHPISAARRFADGLSSWLVLRSDGHHEWLIFDRPAGSERDVVVLARVLEATIVQRHPMGAVRIVGPFGVLRWDGISWHHEPPVSSWVDVVTAGSSHDESAVLEALIDFAVHDLGAMGIGALLVHRSAGAPEAELEEMLPAPPPLDVRRPVHLAPLRHALTQVDGAALFDSGGVLRRLGVRLAPSQQAEVEVESFRGMRHTSGRRYSFDDPHATVVAVSDDGPVSVLRRGAVLGRSPMHAEAEEPE